MGIKPVTVRVQLPLFPSTDPLPLVYARGQDRVRRQEIPMPVFKKLKRWGTTDAKGIHYGYFRAVWDDIMDRWDVRGEAATQVQDW